MFTLPWSPTEAFPHPMSTIGAGVLYNNKKSYALVEGVMWLGLGSIINRFRAESLELPSISDGAGRE